jgi:hypothetical protein
MAQSRHTKCSFCEHRPHHHHEKDHKKHHGSKGPKDGKGKEMVVVPDVKSPMKKPEEKPWSKWIAGDDGLYFYRGRHSSVTGLDSHLDSMIIIC